MVFFKCRKNTICSQRRRQWHPTPVLLPGESQGRGSLVGCRLWGHTESDMTEATQQQQQHSGCLQIIELKFIFSYLFLSSLFFAAWPAGSQFLEPGIETVPFAVKALVLTTALPLLNFLNANYITLIQYVLLLFK